MDNRFLRNKDLISQNKLDEVTIIGAGGVGSCLALSASIMGFKVIHLWDYDKLEEHNLSTTMYPERYLGLEKTEASKRLSEYFGCNTEIRKYDTWTLDSPLTPCVMMAPDNMEVRKMVYMQWIRTPGRKMLIDGRMGALTLEVISCDRHSDNYLSTWQSSDKIPDEQCTAKHTIFTANVVAGIMLSQAFNVLHNRLYHSYIWMSLAPFSSRKERLVNPLNRRSANAQSREARTSISKPENTIAVRSPESR